MAEAVRRALIRFRLLWQLVQPHLAALGQAFTAAAAEAGARTVISLLEAIVADAVARTADLYSTLANTVWNIMTYMGMPKTVPSRFGYLPDIEDVTEFFKAMAETYVKYRPMVGEMIDELTGNTFSFAVQEAMSYGLPGLLGMNYAYSMGTMPSPAPMDEAWSTYEETRGLVDALTGINLHYLSHNYLQGLLEYYERVWSRADTLTGLHDVLEFVTYPKAVLAAHLGRILPGLLDHLLEDVRNVLAGLLRRVADIESDALSLKTLLENKIIGETPEAWLAYYEMDAERQAIDQLVDEYLATVQNILAMVNEKIDSELLNLVASAVSELEGKWLSQAKAEIDDRTTRYIDVLYSARDYAKPVNVSYCIVFEDGAKICKVIKPPEQA